MPAIETAPPVAIPQAITVRMRNLFIFSPMLMAVSSPKLRSEYCCLIEFKIKIPAKINGKDRKRSLIERLATEPSIQFFKSKKKNGFGAKFKRTDIIAPDKLDIPTPIKIKVTVERTLNAAKIIMAVAIIAPDIDATGKINALFAEIP